MLKVLLFTFLAAFSTLALAGPPSVWGPNQTAQMLVPGISFSPLANTTYLLSGANNPSSVATLAPKGSLYLSTSGSAYLKGDAGLSTNWSPVLTGSTTGGANTAAFFNSSGVLSSGSNFRYTDVGSYLVLSSSGGGATAGNAGVGGSNTGASLVVGDVNGVSSIVSTNFGAGNIAFGSSQSGGQISAQFNGSMAGGYTTTLGIVTTEHNGSLAVGEALSSGQVAANGEATFALGYADSSSILGAVGAGSMVMGYATGSTSLISTQTGKFGQFAGGYSQNTGNIATTGNGALSYGYSDTQGSIAAGSTPTCGAGQDGSLALTNGHKLCVCVNPNWKNASDGSTACTF